MAEPAFFEELHSAIEAALDAEITDFFELAAMLGLEPKHDFSGADLSGADLSGGDLSYANFAETNFKEANLSSINLQRATLTNADLQRAILTNADLSFANLGFPTDVSLELDHVLELSLKFARDRDYGPALNLVLDRAFTLARFVSRSRGLALAPLLVQTLKLARDLALGLDRPVVHARNSALAEDLTLAYTHARNLRGTNLKGANLQGANLRNANVEGAIMTGCQGLSPSDIADLRARGAIFNDSLGDLLVINAPRPKVPR